MVGLPELAALEYYSEAEIFKRTANGVEVTQAGATLRETAEIILQTAEDAKAKMSLEKQNLPGTITIIFWQILRRVELSRQLPT